jgi:hypothetical protein
MGFDVSYHPVDLELVLRLARYVAGQGSIEELVDRACGLELRRFRAKAWGLALINVQHAEHDAWREAARKGKTKSKTKKKADDAPVAMRTVRVDSNLHVWGRPFLITADEPPEVSTTIDSYLAATTNGEIDSLARQAIKRIAPGLEKELKPELEGGPPAKKELPGIVLRDLDVLPEVYEAARRGKRTMTLPSGDSADPKRVLASSLPLLVLAFTARFRPGWMDRGTVWPSLLMQEARLAPRGFFDPPRALFGALLEELPSSVGKQLSATITENYMVGGLVPAERVPELRRLLLDKREALLGKPRKEGWEEECLVSLRKIDEALADAEERGLPFAEATEVYSGPLGIMN